MKGGWNAIQRVWFWYTIPQESLCFAIGGWWSLLLLTVAPITPAHVSIGWEQAHLINSECREDDKATGLLYIVRKVCIQATAALVRTGHLYWLFDTVVRWVNDVAKNLRGLTPAWVAWASRRRIHETNHKLLWKARRPHSWSKYQEEDVMDSRVWLHYQST